FFQAEDGIRDFHVTGVQTCALPIFRRAVPPGKKPHPRPAVATEFCRLGWQVVMSRAKARVPSLSLEPAQEQVAVQVLQRFLEERFELELGSFEVQEVLELIGREIAPHYYDKAIADVQTVLADRFASIESDVWALEKS